MSNARLILVDLHPLEPFLVRSHQFASRAASFAQHWGGPVELWLPSPPIDSARFSRRIGFEAPGNLKCEFGPPPFISLFGWKMTSRAPFRGWVRRRMKQLAARREQCLFYFRTLKLAHSFIEPLREHHWDSIFEPHEVFFENARHPEQLREVERAVYERAAALFPISHALEQRLKEQFAVVAPMYVGPLGHGGANFSVPPYDPFAPASFLYIGSLHKWKGLEMAFKATAGLGVPFHVVGDAGGLERCREFCRQRGFQHVTFHGHVAPENLPPFYTPGCICLLPLSDEIIARAFTSPLKLFEYLAAGRPVVVGDLPTTQEIVTDRINARLVPVNDVSAWRAALTEMLQDRAATARLASAARELARSCTWTTRAKPLVEKMRALLEGEAPGSGERSRVRQAVGSTAIL